MEKPEASLDRELRRSSHIPATISSTDVQKKAIIKLYPFVRTHSIFLLRFLALFSKEIVRRGTVKICALKAPGKCKGMEPGQVKPLEYILSSIGIGVAILDADSFCIRYVNPYLHTLLQQPWRDEDIAGRLVEEVLPAKLPVNIIPLLRHVAETGQSIQYAEAPFEGFLETRGRTYWRISIERRHEKNNVPKEMQDDSSEYILLITVEDVTESVRSRLHLNAIHYISSAIAGPSSLHLVLDRILQVLQDMFGSKRCAIFLIDSTDGETIGRSGPEEQFSRSLNPSYIARVVAQKGLHQASHNWNLPVSDKVLPGQIIHKRQSLIITDTSLLPEIELPFINHKDKPCRPGSVLSVPIFEPSPTSRRAYLNDSSAQNLSHTDTVLGTVEVYHRRARSFPAEEVRLLEQFAQHAGLAIQLARTIELKQRNAALQQAQEALETTNAQMSLLLKHLPSGVLLVSAQDGSIGIINQQAVQLLQQMGISLEPIDDLNEASKRTIGRNCEQLLRSIPMYGAANTPIAYEETPLYKALVHGQDSEVELHTQKKDGQEIQLLVNAAPLLGADGTITSAILVYQEITRIKDLERSREDFFTTMAHELKTPLANIRAHLSALLARDLEWSNEEKYDFLQTADEQVERLVGMINHFLDASRVEAGALRLEIEPILVPELCEDLQDRLEALIRNSQRQLQLQIESGLPAARGDYELIMSVLINLLSNAFRYTPQDDAVVLKVETVHETDSAKTAGIRFSVTDHGPGISEEQQKALFTRFSTFAAMSRLSVDRPGQLTSERREKTTRWSPATGLGLYISRGIIEAHESQLALSSNPGQGAVFSFILPVFRRQHKQKRDTTQAITLSFGGRY